MRPFRSFFIMSLIFFIFLFFARFIIFAFIAAAVLTFLAFIIRKISMISRYRYWEDDFQGSWQRRHSYALPNYRREEEPLFFEKEKETEFDWLKDYRTIKVQ